MEFMKQLVFLLTPLAAGFLFSSSAKAQGLPDGEGKDTYESVCGACHGADIVIGSQGTRSRWEETVDAMKNRGSITGSRKRLTETTDDGSPCTGSGGACM